MAFAHLEMYESKISLPRQSASGNDGNKTLTPYIYPNTLQW